MKNILFFLLFIISLTMYSQQYTTIPDVNFEIKLINLGIDKNIVPDGKVLTTAIVSISSLNVSSSSNRILDLTGIQDFAALKTLDCSGNFLTSLDVTKNLALIELRCYSNAITNLNVSKNIALTTLLCYTNAITNLDVTKNLALTDLYCSSNQLTTLDVTKNLVLTDLYCGSNKLTNLDVTKNLALTNLNCKGEIPFSYLTNLDVSKNLGLKTLDCSGNFLKSLDVTENLALTDLYCSSNQLTNLDVSKNLALTTFYCYSNQIINLDVTKNLALTIFNCYSNQIINLDVTKNTVLTTFNCYSNQITSLNVSKNITMITFNCHNNKLLNLNLKNGKNTLLSNIYSSFKNNPNLTCIQVDDVNYSNTNWAENKDISCGYSADCSSYTLIPDVNFEKKLIALGIDSGGVDGKVLTASIWSLAALNVSSSSIKDLTGIQDFIRLTNLDCSSNQLINLDVTKNLALTALYCSTNQLTNLDVSKNITLTTFSCSYNNITNLDIQANVALETIRCNNNNLLNLNLKNGNNILLSIVDFTINPNLTCILVDNVGYSYTNWASKKDATASYVPSCGQKYTAIPDINFEKKLISLGIDSGAVDGAVLTSNITSLTDLNVSSSSIKNLTGIQDFVGLTTLYCHLNQITTLDVSKNLALNTLSCSSNQLTSLDISKNIALTTFSCALNQIKSIDVSKNLAMIVFSCSSNQISSINVSKHTALKQFQCSSNQLTNLDVSKNVALTVFACNNNKLLNLNLKNGNNTNLDMLNSSFINNPTLICIQVDNAAYSDSNWAWRKDTTASFSSTCTLGIEDSVFDKIIIYPNPTKGQLHIDNIILEKATVYNANGELVRTELFTKGLSDNSINLSDLSKGIYYIYLQSANTNATKKIIVE